MGNIMLGNLKLEDIVDVDKLEEVERVFKKVGLERQDIADVKQLKDNEYHIFDIPSLIVIKNTDLAADLVGELTSKGLVKAFNRQVQVSIFKESN